MRKLIVLLLAACLSGCATIQNHDPDQMRSIEGHIKQDSVKYDTVKTVLGAVALIAIAGYVGKSQHDSKCQNNRAGFYQDHSTGKIYTC